jgi:hypothetical protein
MNFDPKYDPQDFVKINFCSRDRWNLNRCSRVLIKWRLYSSKKREWALYAFFSCLMYRRFSIAYKWQTSKRHVQNQ